ncbi:tail fiber assembly protein [Serratia plymuthica]|uniref:tail fiber assembly protein n=1 Tax=Serratia plymuthica TaxID=82996 RepID=UPI003B9EB233
MSNFSFSDSDQALWLFHFDSAGVYIGSGLAIVPAGTGLPAKTTIKPCNSPEGKTGIWDGESWDYVQDNRGVRYWNQYGAGSVVVAIDEVIPVDAILVEPPRKKDGFSLLFADGAWQQIENKTGQKYYGSLGETFIVDDPYFTLPDEHTFVEPPKPKGGYATQWNGLEWVYIEDYRGKTAFNIHTAAATVVSVVGPLDADYTFVPPTSMFDEWNGDSWVLNEEKKKQAEIVQAQQKKVALRSEADAEIAVRADAVKYGIATEQEKNELEAWETYRVLLMRVDTNLAPDIEWPVKP